MSVVTLPATLKIGEGSGIGQRRFDLLTQSDTTGSQQTRLLGPPRWTLRLQQPQWLSLAEAGQWAALLAQLRGRVNVLVAWDPARPAPRGTARGTITTSGALSAGAVAMTLSCGVAGVTLLAGDWLQVGTGLGTSQLVMITADATANGSGVMSVGFEPPLRQGYSSGTAVAWDKPLAYFRQQADTTTWSYVSGGLAATGMACDLMEVWA